MASGLWRSGWFAGPATTRSTNTRTQPGRLAGCTDFMTEQNDPITPKLRVWWIPQVPGEGFIQRVATPREGALLLRALALYDAFQHEHNIKPDYCNAGGFEQFNEEEQEWEDWESETFDSIDDLSEAILSDLNEDSK